MAFEQKLNWKNLCSRQLLQRQTIQKKLGVDQTWRRSLQWQTKATQTCLWLMEESGQLKPCTGSRAPASLQSPKETAAPEHTRCATATGCPCATTASTLPPLLPCIPLASPDQSPWMVTPYPRCCLPVKWGHRTTRKPMSQCLASTKSSKPYRNNSVPFFSLTQAGHWSFLVCSLVPCEFPPPQRTLLAEQYLLYLQGSGFSHVSAISGQTLALRMSVAISTAAEIKLNSTWF